MYRKVLKTRGPGKIQFRDTPLDKNKLYEPNIMPACALYDLMGNKYISNYRYSHNPFYAMHFPEAVETSKGLYMFVEQKPSIVPHNSEEALVEFIKVRLLNKWLKKKKW